MFGKGISTAPIGGTNKISNNGVIVSGIAKYNTVLSAIKTGGIKVSGVALYTTYYSPSWVFGSTTYAN